MPVCCMSLSQLHAEVSPLPRLPELYLEAGAALLMARRPADCMALCDEVISTTLELLPETLVVEEPEEKCEAEARAVDAKGEDRVGMLLWTGAAYLLQGHCHTHLKEWKQAVTHYTRSARWNWLYFCHCFFAIVKKKHKIWLCVTGVSTFWWKCALKRQVSTFLTFLMLWREIALSTHPKATVTFCILFCWLLITGCQPQIPSADMVGRQGTDLCVLQRLKGLSLAGRGISFSQTDQLREALRDLQLSLQAFPGTHHSFNLTIYCIQQSSKLFNVSHMNFRPILEQCWMCTWFVWSFVRTCHHAVCTVSGCVGAGLWCGEVLWRLGRRWEAAACWEKTWSFTKQSSVE